MVSTTQALTTQFYEWEQLGRGWAQGRLCC